MPGARSRSSGVGKARIIIPILLIRKLRLGQVMEFAQGHTAEQVTEPDLHPQTSGCFLTCRRPVMATTVLISHLGRQHSPSSACLHLMLGDPCAAGWLLTSFQAQILEWVRTGAEPTLLSVPGLQEPSKGSALIPTTVASSPNVTSWHLAHLPLYHHLHTGLMKYPLQP